MSKKRSATPKETSVTENTQDPGLEQAAAEAGTEQAAEQAQEAAATDTAPTGGEDATAVVVEDVKTEEVKEADAAIEPSELERALSNAVTSGNPVLVALGSVLTNYIAKMGESKGTDYNDVIDLNAQLWVVLRKAVNTSTSFRDSIQLALTVFRLNPDGAFKLPMLLRGIDNANSRLNAEHRTAYTGLVTILETASRLANPAKVSQMVSLSAALKSEAFSDDARQRVIGFFSE